MKSVKNKSVKKDRTARRLFGYNYEVILKNEGETVKPKEEFDKKNLSEADMDKILAAMN